MDNLKALICQTVYRKWLSLSLVTRRIAGSMILFLGIVVVLSVGAVAIADTVRRGDISKSFTWEVSKDDETATPWVLIRYQDGRTFALKIQAIIATQYYPEHLANTFGHDGATLLVIYQGGSLRLNVDDKNGQSLVEYTTSISK